MTGIDGHQLDNETGITKTVAIFYTHIFGSFSKLKSKYVVYVCKLYTSFPIIVFQIHREMTRENTEQRISRIFEKKNTSCLYYEETYPKM